MVKNLNRRVSLVQSLKQNSMHDTEMMLNCDAELKWEGQEA